MPTLKAEWNFMYPKPVAKLLRVIAVSSKAQKGESWTLTNARKAIAERLVRDGYALQVSKKVRAEGSLSYPDTAVIMTRAPFEISIDFAKSKPEIDPIKRLANSPGIKVLVLTECGYYDPRAGSGEWHRVDPLDLSKIDFLIGARARVLEAQTPEQLEPGYVEHSIDTRTVLEMIDEAWKIRRPMSGHGNVGEFDAQRYLPKILVDKYQAHPTAAAKALRDMKSDGLIETAKDFTTTMRGFRLTQKGKDRLLELQH